MSSVEYHRLALLQYVLFQQQLEECVSLEAQIAQLKQAVAARHKKHRRCDKEISKTNKCHYCEKLYASEIALKLHLKLKHRAEEKNCSGTEDSQLMEGSQCEPVQAIAP